MYTTLANTVSTVGSVRDNGSHLAGRRALEAAGVEFIDENGSGPGVCLRKKIGRLEKGVRNSGHGPHQLPLTHSSHIACVTGAGPLDRVCDARLCGHKLAMPPKLLRSPLQSNSL
jgi:hypothetical protein